MSGITIEEVFGQIFLGIINGSFYALLSLGLALIFGMLRIVNFAHGMLYTAGAFGTFLLFREFGISYYVAILVVPVAAGILSAVVERLFLRRIYEVEHHFQLLLMYSLALIIEGTLRALYGTQGFSYRSPIAGGVDLGGFLFVPYYRGFVVLVSLVVCAVTWYVVERTKLGSYLRAVTENPEIVRTFGINVPLLITLTFGSGAALAAFAGVMAAPLYQITPSMGVSLLLVVFAVIVIGGLGSLGGAILVGYGLGILEGITKLVYPAASVAIIFVAMVLVLLFKPNGLFGTEVRQ